MVSLYNIVQGPGGAPPILVPQAGGVPAAGQLAVHLFIIPGPGGAGEGNQPRALLLRVIYKIYEISLGVFNSIKAVFDDINATSDFLQFFINITDFCEKKNYMVPTARALAGLFKASMSVNTPRSLFYRLHSLYSGEAATREPLWGNHNDWLRVGSKLSFMVSDIYKTTEWIKEAGILTSDVLKNIGFVSCCEQVLKFTILGTIASIAGSVCNAFDDARLIYDYSSYREDTPELERKIKLCGFVLDLIVDITRIACAILLTPVPGDKIIAEIVIGCILNVVSLSKFLIQDLSRKSKEREKALIDQTQAEARGLIEREIGLATHSLNHVNISQVALNLKDRALATLAPNRGRIQRLLPSALALSALADAIVKAPAAPPLPLPPIPGAPPPPPSLAIPRHQLEWAWNHLQLVMPPPG